MENLENFVAPRMVNPMPLLSQVQATLAMEKLTLSSSEQELLTAYAAGELSFEQVLKRVLATSPAQQAA